MLEKNQTLGEDLKQTEFQRIAGTLNQYRGHRQKTAEALGISPRTLRYKLAQMREMGYSC